MMHLIKSRPFSKTNSYESSSSAAQMRRARIAELFVLFHMNVLYQTLYQHLNANHRNRQRICTKLCTDVSECIKYYVYEFRAPKEQIEILRKIANSNNMTIEEIIVEEMKYFVAHPGLIIQ